MTKKDPLKYCFVFVDIVHRDRQYFVVWNSRLQLDTGEIIIDEGFGHNEVLLEKKYLPRVPKDGGIQDILCILNKIEYQLVLKKLHDLQSYTDRLKSVEYPNRDALLDGRVSGLRKSKSFLEDWAALNECDLQNQRSEPTQGDNRKIVELSDAARAVLNQYEKVGRKGDRIDICVEYLKNHDIRGKPGYTSEKLNNRISRLENKIKNKQHPPR